MQYIYNLNTKDFKQLNIKTNVKKGFIYQSGWTGKFENKIYYTEYINNIRNDRILSLINLTNEQENYIIEKCKCMEVD